MKSCLITGSSGLIGSEVAFYFGHAGFRIHGVGNNHRAVSFGPQGDTRWNQRRIEKKIADFQHHGLDVRSYDLRACAMGYARHVQLGGSGECLFSLRDVAQSGLKVVTMPEILNGGPGGEAVDLLKCDIEGAVRSGTIRKLSPVDAAREACGDSGAALARQRIKAVGFDWKALP